MTGRNPITLCRPGAERPQEEGWHEPYESRGSRTDLWGTGGEIPPVYPAMDPVVGRIGGNEDFFLNSSR